jgi:hypothetical protein
METAEAITFDERGREVNSSPFLTFKLSWVAYVREPLAFIVRMLILGVVALLVSTMLDRGFLRKDGVTWPMLLAFLLAIAWTVYSIAYTASVRLFTNDSGVWMQRGVFPWETGVTGVQWRDVGQAGFTQGFASWALRSYDVVVSHRFSTGTELAIRNVHRGDLAVQHINGIMGQLQGRVMPS